jgi:hypothetical protein
MVVVASIPAMGIADGGEGLKTNLSMMGVVS